jgi:hypothetical protein
LSQQIASQFFGGDMSIGGKEHDFIIARLGGPQPERVRYRPSTIAISSSVRPLGKT